MGKGVDRSTHAGHAGYCGLVQRRASCGPSPVQSSPVQCHVCKHQISSSAYLVRFSEGTKQVRRVPRSRSISRSEGTLGWKFGNGEDGSRRQAILSLPKVCEFWCGFDWLLLFPGVALQVSCLSASHIPSSSGNLTASESKSCSGRAALRLRVWLRPHRS